VKVEKNKTLYNQLIECLKDELEVIRELNQALEIQQKALLDGDVAGLQESLGAVEEFQKRVQAAEERRAGILAAASVEGLGPDATLSEILARAPEGIGLELHMVATQLVELVERLARLNNVNFVLSANAHRFNQYLLKHVVGSRDRYGADAQLEIEGKNILLNAKV